MTLEEWKEAGIDAVMPLIYYESGLEWLEERTTMEIKDHTVETVKALPNKAKLFLMEFAAIMQRESGVTGESVSGISQNFSERGKDALIMQAAKGLLSGWLKSSLLVPLHS